MKNGLPWLLVLILVAAAAFLFNQGKSRNKELMQLRGEASEIEQLRVSLAELKTAEAQNSAAVPTSKEREELIRLRNEVGLLRRDKQKLEQQFQQAEQRRERLQEVQQAQSQQAQQIQQLQQQNQQLAQQNQVQETAKATSACINNLRQLDGAIQQWALEYKQTAEAAVMASDITPYLSKETMPACPAGGIYTLVNVRTAPACSAPGHALPQ